MNPQLCREQMGNRQTTGCKAPIKAKWWVATCVVLKEPLCLCLSRMRGLQPLRMVCLKRGPANPSGCFWCSVKHSPKNGTFRKKHRRFIRSIHRAPSIPTGVWHWMTSTELKAMVSLPRQALVGGALRESWRCSSRGFRGSG